MKKTIQYLVILAAIMLRTLAVVLAQEKDKHKEKHREHKEKNKEHKEKHMDHKEKDKKKKEGNENY